VSKIGRNKPCSCGSGKKFKKCCGRTRSEEPVPPNFEQLLRLMGASSSAGMGVHDKKFDKVQRDLEAMFTAYSAEDIILTLGVSDLWLPNIASQVKHFFAFGIFAAIAPDRFNSNSRIENYDAFCNVLKRIHEILPTFPTLEDYVPESDWGEVRSHWQGKSLRLFYGSALERVPDFVEAFRLTNADKPLALEDMYTAILLQDRILTSIDRSLVGDASNISSGHIEIPSAPFWQVCREALRSVGRSFSDHTQVSPELILDLGKLEFPKSLSAFGDAVMDGNVLPGLFVRTGKALIPVAPRSAVINIVDFWGRRAQAAPFRGHRSLTQQVSDFLASRIDYRSISPGPCWIRDGHRRVQAPFAAVLRGGPGFYFVVIWSRENLDRLPTIEAELLDLVTSSPNWGIQLDGASHGFQFRHVDGSGLKPDEIVMLAVLPQESTSVAMYEIPQTRSAHVLPIADLVSIFDSIEDLSEFDRFWAYIKENRSAIRSSFLSLADIFAAFRYSHGVLIDGAIQPDLVMLDPHGGSNWRYEELAKFWSMAPACFPDDDPRGWMIEFGEDGVLSLNSKAKPVQTWATTVAGCTLLFVHRMQLDLDRLDIRVLGIFAHCVADAIYRRRGDIETAEMFRRHRIIVEVRANTAALASEPLVEGSDIPMLQGWEQIDGGGDDASVSVCVSVNLSHVLVHFEEPADDSFEISCACSILDGVAAFLGEPLDVVRIQKMQSAPPGRPRFALIRSQRTVDVPDFLDPQKLRPAMFKLARKDIAVIFKENSVEPGRYELAEAKRVIDLARNAFRDQLHRQIARFNKDRVLSYCIAQHDAWTAEFHRTRDRLQHSLKHEVSYDRSHAFAEAQRKFTNESRNFRFLLECCLSLTSTDNVEPAEDDILQLVAHVDWLLVLYGASDVLHNGIEAGGIEIDDQFVPRVFYADERADQEGAFSREQANYGLGIDLDPNVDAMPLGADDGSKASLDKAFLDDAQFSFSHMMDALSVLMQWQSFNGRSDFQLCYRATKAEIVEALCSFIEGISADEANKIITFLTLNRTEIRRLIGKHVDEGDVPIWEHNKRGGRYTIKPLVPADQDLLAWGAASAQKARSIWAGNITSGYLPADFDWPSVQGQVRAVKQAFEKGLERQTSEIVSNYAPFVVSGIDFKRRFPKEKFDDVGDFDVLAYWPQEGKWLVGECKYNQPPFCLKDARRLRERIFGIPPDRGQFSKIGRRRVFLAANIDRLRELLNWPAPVQTTAVSVDELYISKEIYWWLRFPPYEVPTQFVRIDYLSAWLTEHNYSLTK
jgi:hypothetical protein